MTSDQYAQIFIRRTKKSTRIYSSQLDEFLSNISTNYKCSPYHLFRFIMITTNGTMKNSAKRLFESEARLKEEIKQKSRFACLTLDMIIQISKKFHDQDYFQIKKKNRSHENIELELEEIPQKCTQENERNEKPKNKQSLITCYFE